LHGVLPFFLMVSAFGMDLCAAQRPPTLPKPPRHFLQLYTQTPSRACGAASFVASKIARPMAHSFGTDPSCVPGRGSDPRLPSRKRPDLCWFVVASAPCSPWCIRSFGPLRRANIKRMTRRLHHLLTAPLAATGYSTQALSSLELFEEKSAVDFLRDFT